MIRRLARNDEIAVAGPVLTQSARLTSDDLIEIAGSKSQQHLLAISGRRELEETVTDVLIERGDRETVHRLARNAGARFSENGFTTLVRNAESDESLAEKLGLRLDIPLRMLRDLLLKATEAVRAKLLSLAPAETRDEIQRVLAKISNEVGREATAVARLHAGAAGHPADEEGGQAERGGPAGICRQATLRADGRGACDVVVGLDRFDRVPDEGRSQQRIADSLQGRRSEMADGRRRSCATGSRITPCRKPIWLRPRKTSSGFRSQTPNEPFDFGRFTQPLPKRPVDHGAQQLGS